MGVKNTTPRNADGVSVLGKSEEHIKANYKGYYNKKCELELLQKITHEELSSLVAKFARNLERVWWGNGGFA